MKLRTIIVEDEKYQAEAVKHLLQQISHAQIQEAGIDGIEVAVANCAAEARKLLQQAALDSKPYDILLLDLGLPETPGNSELGDRGLEILKFAREHNATRGVIIISVFTELDRYVNPAFRLGASDFIGKPYNEDEMLIRVLRVWRQVREQHRQRVLGQLMKASLRELAPYADKGVNDRLSSCFSKFMQSVRNETDGLRSALLDQFDHSSPGDLPRPLRQPLFAIGEAIDRVRDEWMRIQKPMRIDDDVTHDLVVENVLEQLREELRPCLAVQLDLAAGSETRILSFQDACQDNALMILREILVGGLTDLTEVEQLNFWKVAVNVATVDGMAEIQFEDNFKPLSAEHAECITKGEHIPPREGQWRAWGLSVLQHIALRGGGRLIVEPREAGNSITYRVMLAQDA